MINLNGYFMFLDQKKRGPLDFDVGPLLFWMRKILRMSLQRMVLYAAMKMFTPYITIFSLTNGRKELDEDIDKVRSNHRQI